MSDTMLLGVLRMPLGLAMATPTAQIQYHQRGVQAADEIEKLTRKLKLVADALNETISKYHEVGDQNDRLDAENERLREALHRVSLASQNSMSSKDECGRIARETLEVKS